MRVEFQAKLLGESVIATFDFTSRLSASETISTASVAASVFAGTDASPSSVISGAATISGQKVTQKIVGGVLGVMYFLVCTITTSLGQTLELSAYLPVVEDQQ